MAASVRRRPSFFLLGIPAFSERLADCDGCPIPPTAVPGESVPWEQTTNKHFFPKKDTLAVARETKEEAAKNKRANRTANVHMEDF